MYFNWAPNREASGLVAHAGTLWHELENLPTIVFVDLTAAQKRMTQVEFRHVLLDPRTREIYVLFDLSFLLKPSASKSGNPRPLNPESLNF